MAPKQSEQRQTPFGRVTIGMINLYRQWCCGKLNRDGRKTLWRLAEREGGRDEVLKDLSDRVLDHYISDEDIAAFVETLGFPKAAENIRDYLPTTAIGKSGDLGEILAAEFVEEQLDFEVPVKRLRYKDHREMPMRGDDVIAVAHDKRKRLTILKGEAKSARRLSGATVVEARERLEKDYGRPSAHSLIFIARKLIQSGDPERKKLGKHILREAADKAVPKGRLAHLLFTLCGNRVKDIIRDDFDTADGERKQYSVNLRVEDHRGFVNAVYEEASSIGDG